MPVILTTVFALLALIAPLVASSAALADDAVVYCTSSSDNLLKRGDALLHDFDNPTDCARARDEARRYGAFCTSSSDNLLKDLHGDVIHDYDSPASCQAGLGDGGGGGGGDTPPPFVFCTSSSDNLLKRGSLVLHDFDNPTDCARARDESRRFGAFCTSSSDNLLKDLEGQVIHDFDSPDACQAGLGDMGGGGRPLIFCTSSSDNLLKRGTTLLHDFDNPTDCGRARDQARQYGAFCTSSSDNLLKDLEGQILHDFDSPDACAAALGQ